MSWLEKIRQKPHAEKIKLIWIICIIVAVVLIVIWIFTSKLGDDLPKDTSVFKKIKQSIQNLN